MTRRGWSVVAGVALVVLLARPVVLLAGGGPGHDPVTTSYDVSGTARLPEVDRCVTVRLTGRASAAPASSWLVPGRTVWSDVERRDTRTQVRVRSCTDDRRASADVVDVFQGWGDERAGARPDQRATDVEGEATFLVDDRLRVTFDGRPAGDVLSLGPEVAVDVQVGSRSWATPIRVRPVLLREDGR